METTDFRIKRIARGVVEKVGIGDHVWEAFLSQKSENGFLKIWSEPTVQIEFPIYEPDEKVAAELERRLREALRQ